MSMCRVILKDDLKWKTNNHMQLFLRKTRIDKSRAYTSSSNLDTSLDIDDNEVEVSPIGQKVVKNGKRKRKSKVNEENKNKEL